MEREGLGQRGAEKIVHAFAGADGKNPRSAVAPPAKGGAFDKGTVFKLTIP